MSGVIETCLYVDDLERASCFYEEQLGLRKMGADDRFCVFSVADRQVLLLFKRGATLQPIPTPGGMIPPPRRKRSSASGVFDRGFRTESMGKTCRSEGHLHRKPSPLAPGRPEPLFPRPRATLGRTAHTRLLAYLLKQRDRGQVAGDRLGNQARLALITCHLRRNTSFTLAGLLRRARGPEYTRTDRRQPARAILPTVQRRRVPRCGQTAW